MSSVHRASDALGRRRGRWPRHGSNTFRTSRQAPPEPRTRNFEPPDPAQKHALCSRCPCVVLADMQISARRDGRTSCSRPFRPPSARLGKMAFFQLTVRSSCCNSATGKHVRQDDRGCGAPESDTPTLTLTPALARLIFCFEACCPMPQVITRASQCTFQPSAFGSSPHAQKPACPWTPVD